MVPGTIRPGSLAENGGDIWFKFDRDPSPTSGPPTDILNGQRICTIEYAISRGFRNAASA